MDHQDYWENPQQPSAPSPANAQSSQASSGTVPGKGAAVASMVLGIISVVLWFFGYTAIISVILGIIGLILAENAKKAGFEGGTRTAGFVLSLIGLIGGGVAFLACVACAGTLGMAGLLD